MAPLREGPRDANEKKKVTWFAMMILLPNIAVNAFGEDEGVRYHHTLTAGVAANEVISENGDQISFSAGFDYLYRLSPKWEVGFQLDLNYDRSFEHHESDAVVPIVSYSVTDRLPVFFGIGLERERSTGETEWLARAGFEYSFFLDGDQHVALLPGSLIDFLDGEVFLSVVLAIGYSF